MDTLPLYEWLDDTFFGLSVIRKADGLSVIKSTRPRRPDAPLPCSLVLAWSVDSILYCSCPVGEEVLVRTFRGLYLSSLN